MKDITQKRVVEGVRQDVQPQHTTPNSASQNRLQEFTAVRGDVHAFDTLVNRINYMDIGRTYIRNERNER